MEKTLDYIHTLSYICPSCKNRIYKKVSYPDPKLFKKPREAQLTVAHWCKECGNRHELVFSIKRKKDGKYRVNTHSFKSNGVEHNKRLRLKPEKET